MASFEWDTNNYRKNLLKHGVSLVEEDIGGGKLFLHVAHADDSGQPSPFPTASNGDQASDSRRSDQNNLINIIHPRGENVKRGV